MLYYHSTVWNDFGSLYAFVFYCFFLDIINDFPVNKQFLCNKTWDPADLLNTDPPV